jgi:hypothetical protein
MQSDIDAYRDTHRQNKLLCSTLTDFGEEVPRVGVVVGVVAVFSQTEGHSRQRWT